MIGITKKEKQILRALQQYEYKSEYCYDDLKIHFENLNEIHFEYCCEHMAENRGLLKIVGRSQDEGKLFVRLTYVGYYYKEFQKQRLIEFVLNSMLTPIAVAFITALVVSLL